MRKHATTARFVLLLGVVAIGLLPAAAVAKPRPTVSWTLPHAVSEGQPIAFSWHGSHLGWRHTLVIQRQVGTSRAWKTVMRLRGNNGSRELPGLALGRYKLRIADLSVIHRVVAQQTVGLGVFGQVPFSTLFGRSEDRSYTIPSGTFPYVAVYYTESETEPLWTVGHNHCSSVHISFVPGNHDERATGVATLRQETLDPVSASTGTDTIGTLDAALAPGQSWSVTMYTIGTEATYYVNGYATCDSTEPWA